MTSSDTGSHAESMALAFLEGEGLTLVTRNFSARTGEIDLIMRDGSTLVFVEVRMRNNPDYGSGAETITRSKISKITRTAEYYLQSNPAMAELPCRFDVISIDDNLDWIREAFTLD